ncbi:hypothetical protein MMC27_000535, partial [Xylographa pallens]|nr:hypothetical protein [Xylographa pallens]
NACEFWFSTLDEEPDSAGRIVTMGGERIELYEVPDAPRNDHSSSGPPVLPERHVTSSLVTPVSIGIEDETDGDTGLFRRIHFVISGNVATVIDVSELNGVENTDVNFSLSGWHDKCSDGVESSPDGGEQPIVSTTPPLISKESKPKKAKKAKKVEEAKKVKEVKKEKSFSSQAISDDRPIPLIYRSPIASPYYHASSNNVYPGRSPTPPPYYHASPTYVHPRRSLPFSPYYYATSTSDDHRRSPTPLPYHCAPLTRNYPRPRTQHSTDQTDGFRLSRLTYYAEYGSQRSIRRSTGQVSHASRFLSRDDKPIDADEVDTIEYYNDSFMDMQIESSRRLNARRTTWKPAERPHTAVRSPQPRPATEADRKLAQIPVGYSLKSWDPTESPIILLGTVFDAKSLGKWIYDWTSYHYPPHSPIREVAGELWLLLIKVAGKMNLAENRFNRIYTTEKREMIEDFLDSGYIIWDRLKKLLKVCEDNMWKAYKRDNSKRRSSNDGQPQSPENHTNSENGENNEASHHKDKRASKGGSKVKGSTDVHAGDQQAADSGSGHGNAESEPLMVQPEERNRSAQFYAADNDLEDKKREKQKSRDSKGVERIQLGVNSGIAFVEALFGRDKALERTEKLMVNMDLWILRFDANCGEILLPKSVTQTVRRGRKSSTEIRSYNRSRSTTPKARNVDIYSVASWNKTRTRSTTPKGRPIHADSRAATRYSNVSEVAGGFSTMNAEQSASTFDSEKQQSDDAKPLEERESLTPATKKKKKRKSKEPVTKDSNSQPEIFEAIKDSEDSRELPLH